MNLTQKEQLALETMKHVSESEFQKFLATTPRAVQSRIENGSSKWQDILPKWFIKYQS